MKFGPRKPSLRKKLAARSSLKRVIRHSLGVKAPKGWGWLTNPKKAAYNRAYNRTTFQAGKAIGRHKRSSAGCSLLLISSGVIVLVLAIQRLLEKVFT
ncbi:MAG TPA: hypothetical protein VGE98_02470 [Thermoanaerobaculia bacterium]